MRRAAVAMSFSSSGEWTVARSVMGISNPRRTTAAERLSSRTAGRARRHEQQHGRGHRHRQRIGTAQGQRFRHQFAQHDMEIGDEAESKGHGHDGGHVRVRSRRAPAVGQQAHPAQKDAGHQRFADPAQGQRTEGDAELHGGQKIVELALQTAYGARSGDAGRPASARCAFRGCETSANSAATKKPLARISMATATHCSSNRPCISPVSIALRSAAATEVCGSPGLNR